MRRKYLKMFSVLLLVVTLIIGGCGPSSQPADQGGTEHLTIVASTSWTGLMAEAAGAKDVTIIAPVELRHPPEYDFRPSDLQLMQEADWILMAGYEQFMRKMIAAGDIPEEKIIQIRTTNTYDNLVAQTRLIAAKLGTEEQQAQWEQMFTETMNRMMEKGEDTGVKNTKILVHTHLGAFAESLGYDVLAVYGAEELSPAKMRELAGLKPDLIIDNYHNPQGMGMAELANAPRVELRNFPGPEHEGLLELMIDNGKKLGIYE